MATAATRNILRIPGRLCADPTDLTLAFPHGGTALGIARDMEFRFGYKTSVATAEEWGGVVNKVFYTGETCIMGAVLRDFDPDMIKKVFPNVATAATGDVTINNDINTGNRAGFDLVAFKLLFSPKSVDRHPHILIYNAIPALDESAQLSLSLGEEIGIGAVFHGSPDSTGRVYSVGLRDNLTL
jgi:hypothetical protein